MSSNTKGDSFIFRERQSSQRVKLLKIYEILFYGVRYGNYERIIIVHNGIK